MKPIARTVLAIAVPLLVWLPWSGLVLEVLPRVLPDVALAQTGALVFLYPVLTGLASGLLGRPWCGAVSGAVTAIVVMLAMQGLLTPPVVAMASAAGVATALVAWPVALLMRARLAWRRENRVGTE